MLLLAAIAFFLLRDKKPGIAADVPTAATNPLLGSWSGTSGECARDSFTFGATTLTITEGDRRPEPVPVTYQVASPTSVTFTLQDGHESKTFAATLADPNHLSFSDNRGRPCNAVRAG